MSSIGAGENAPRLAVGDLVAGKYRVERILGEGGMGVVVAAKHEELGQRVAIKVLRPELAGFEGALERFLREARAAARLESDHVARVFDVGKIGDDCAYMVMEYLEGQDLEQMLAYRGRLNVEETVDYVLEAIEAISHAHAAGMVHRDIKPSNLFLAEKAGGSRRIKVLDFGISKTEASLGVGGQSTTLTSPQALLGSPAYMAPEQIRSSKTVDQRADIWSLGVILYELLSGISPFAGESVGETFARVIDGAPEPLQKLRDDLPPPIVAVVEKCLQSNKDRRFANVADLAEALAPFASVRAQDLPGRISRVLGMSPGRASFRSIVPVEPASAVNDSAATIAAATDMRPAGQTVSAWSNTEGEPRRSKRAVYAAGGLIALLGFGIAGFFLFGRGSSATAVPPITASASTSGTSTLGVLGETKAPEIAPIIDAKPAPSAAASASVAQTSSAAVPIPLGKPSAVASATSKKPTPPPGKPKYPNGLLEGRD